jgi:hypothetical protein
MSETVAVRQAALLLHGLEPAVQRAVLAKLAKADAERLRSLLSELAEMGVSPALGRRLNGSAIAANGASPEKKVEQLGAETIIVAVEDLAPVTIAQLVRAREWPWKAQVLALLPEPVCTAVGQALLQELPALPPAAVHRLCERLWDRVERRIGWTP